MTGPARSTGRDGAGERITVRADGRYLVIPVRDIVSVESEGRTVRIHAAGRAVIARVRLGEIEARLPRQRFVRLHRCHLAHRDHIVELSPKSHGDMHARLSDGRVVTVSRTRRAAVMRSLVGGAG